MRRSFLITVQDFACGRLDDLGADLRLDVLDQLDGLLVLLLGDQRQLSVAQRLKWPNDLETHLLGDQVKYGAHVGDDVLFVQSIERFWVLTKMATGIFDCWSATMERVLSQRFLRKGIAKGTTACKACGSARRWWEAS